MSAMDRNECPESNGIGVRNAPEYAYLRVIYYEGQKRAEMVLVPI